jgi:hypothetical protein
LFLALGNDQFGHPIKNRQNLGTFDSFFGRVLFGRDLRTVLGKKLLRSSATRSAATVIVPMDFLSHKSNSEDQIKQSINQRS